MPELPEVETICRALAPFVEGRKLRHLEILDARWCMPAPPESLADAVDGKKVERVWRRGKYLVWSLAGELHIVMHLRMTGNMLVVGPKEERPHTRVVFHLTGKDRVLFTDPRRFGTGVVLLGDDALDEYFNARIGIEPLGTDFTTDAFKAMAQGRKQPVKAFLLTQARVAGVGNIYADEALFKAKIHPLKPVGTLKRQQLDDLREAVIAVLNDGIANKGASIDDFRNPDGAYGSFQTRFQVHLRAGEPCVRCGTTIKKMRAAGRGTYVCERCQPKPRVKRVSASSRP